MVRVEIDRTKWSRGVMGSNALLVGPDTLVEAEDNSCPDDTQPSLGHMCCLGFVCLALGATPEVLLDKPMPNNVVDLPLPGLVMGGYKNTKFARDAAIINDDNRTDEDREHDLTELAAQNGFEFVFIN